jgi:phage regulator Rha-like protein
MALQNISSLAAASYLEDSTRMCCGIYRKDSSLNADLRSVGWFCNGGYLDSDGRQLLVYDMIRPAVMLLAMHWAGAPLGFAILYIKTFEAALCLDAKLLA